MTDLVQPEWMKGYVSKGDGRFKPGQSGNPKGRPPGIIDKRTKVTQALLDDAPQVARVVIDAALEGDMQAANLVLARIAPPIRAQAEKVVFALDPDAPLAEQASQVLAAVSEGKLDVETARTLIGCIQSVAGIKAVEELEGRVKMLEARPI